jgi:hypothetical protein
MCITTHARRSAAATATPPCCAHSHALVELDIALAVSRHVQKVLLCPAGPLVADCILIPGNFALSLAARAAVVRPALPRALTGHEAPLRTKHVGGLRAVLAAGEQLLLAGRA